MLERFGFGMVRIGRSPHSDRSHFQADDGNRGVSSDTSILHPSRCSSLPIIRRNLLSARIRCGVAGVPRRKFHPQPLRLSAVERRSIDIRCEYLELAEEKRIYASDVRDWRTVSATVSYEVLNLAPVDVSLFNLPGPLDNECHYPLSRLTLSIPG